MEEITGIVKEEHLSDLRLYILLDGEGNSYGIIDLPPESQKDGKIVRVAKEKLKMEKETGLSFMSLLSIYLKKIELDEFIQTIKTSSNNPITAFNQVSYYFLLIYTNYFNTLFKNLDLLRLISKIIIKLLWEIESLELRQNNPIKSEDLILSMFENIRPKFEHPLDTVMCFLYLAFRFNVLTKMPEFYEFKQKFYEKKEYYWLLAAIYSKYVTNPDFFYCHGRDFSGKGPSHVYFFTYKNRQLSFHSKDEWDFPNIPEVGTDFWDGIHNPSFPWDIKRFDFYKK